MGHPLQNLRKRLGHPPIRKQSRIRGQNLDPSHTPDPGRWDTHFKTFGKGCATRRCEYEGDGRRDFKFQMRLKTEEAANSNANADPSPLKGIRDDGVFFRYLRRRARTRGCGHRFRLACWMDPLGPRLKQGAATRYKPGTFLTDWTGHIPDTAYDSATRAGLSLLPDGVRTRRRRLRLRRDLDLRSRRLRRLRLLLCRRALAECRRRKS